MAHRSGCPRVGCSAATWGECARSAHISTQWLGGTGVSYGDEKKWNAENASYAQARKDGLSPESVTAAAVNRAYDNASKG